MDLNSNATINQSQLSPSMQELLERKLRKLNGMSIHEIYQMPEVKQNDFRLYKEAIGLISPDQVKREQDEMRDRSEQWQVSQEQIQQQQQLQEITGAYQPPSQVPKRSAMRDQQPRMQAYPDAQNMGGTVPGDSLLDNMLQPNKLPQATPHMMDYRAPQQPPHLMDNRMQPQPVKAALPAKSPRQGAQMFNSNNLDVNYGGPQSAAQSNHQGASLGALQFSKLILRVKYETSFGQDLWLLGSPEWLSAWNPDKNGGRGGMQMKWTEGHLWVAEIPYPKVVQIGPEQAFEFKFMVKFNNTTAKTYNIIRWEGGTQNHKYYGKHVQTLLQEDNAKKMIQQQLGNRFVEKTIKIGTIQGQSRMVMAGSPEENSIPDKIDKSVILYDPTSQALIYHQYWQA